MARTKVYPLGKKGPREISPGEIHAILARRSEATLKGLVKRGRMKKRESNLDDK
jgi:hypothetical protein